MFTKPVHGGFLMEYLIPSMDNGDEETKGENHVAILYFLCELSELPNFPGHLAISLRRFCFKATYRTHR